MELKDYQNKYIKCESVEEMSIILQFLESNNIKATKNRTIDDIIKEYNTYDTILFDSGYYTNTNGYITTITASEVISKLINKEMIYETWN